MSGAPDWNDLDGLAREVAKTETPGEAMLLCGLWGSRHGWRPRAQHEVAGFRVDIAVPEAKVAIESDGFAHHSSAADLERDHARQNGLVAAGWTPLRYTAQQSFLTTGQCAVSALREINKRLKGRSSAQPRPEEPRFAAELTSEQRAGLVDGAKALLAALEARDPDAPPPPRRRRT